MVKEIIYLPETAEEFESDAYPIFIPSMAVLISSATKYGRANIAPIVAWTIISRFPFMALIALCYSHYTKNYWPRYSGKVIRETGEYVINIPHTGLIDAISLTGQVSGNDPNVDKFKLAGLTPGPSQTIKAPIIMECPINLECKVTEVIRPGSHELFIAKVQAIQHDPLLRQDIRDDLMIIDMILDVEKRGEAQETRIIWQTLPKPDSISAPKGADPNN